MVRFDSLICHNLFLDAVPGVDVALGEHKRQLRSAFGLGLLFEFLKKFSHDRSLSIRAIIGHASHGDGHLLSPSKALLPVLVKFDKDEVIVHLKYLLEVVWLKLWGEFASQKHRSLLRCVVHTEKAFHLAWMVDCLKGLFGVE